MIIHRRFHPSCTNSQIIRPEEVINWGKIQYFLPIKHFAPTFNHFPPTFNHCAPTNNQFAPSLPPPYIGIRSQKNIRFALLCIPYIRNILMLHPREIKIITNSYETPLIERTMMHERRSIYIHHRLS